MSSAFSNVGVQGAPGSTLFAQLFDQTLQAAAATIDTGVNGIAQSSSHIMVMLYLRSDKVATVDSVQLTINGDTGANYYTESAEAFGTGSTNATGKEDLGTAFVDLEDCPAASAPSDVFSPMTLLVPSYAGSHKKALTGLAGYRTGSLTGNILAKALIAWWDSAAAINRITVTASSKFVIGSRMSIYGLG